MTTVLQYLVIAAVIGLVVFGLTVFVFGRGEQLAPLSPRSSPTELPDHGLAAQDVRKVRFAMALRGYRMSDVDWALEKVADEIDRLRAEVDVLTGSVGTGDGLDEDHPDENHPDEDPDENQPDRPDKNQSDLDHEPVFAGVPGLGGRHQGPKTSTPANPDQKDTL